MLTMENMKSEIARKGVSSISPLLCSQSINPNLTKTTFQKIVEFCTKHQLVDMTSSKSNIPLDVILEKKLF